MRSSGVPGLSRRRGFAVLLIIGLLASSGAGATSVRPLAPTYPITVHETGLKSGMTWHAAINSHLQASSGTTIVFTEPFGSYTVQILAIPGYDSNASAIPVTITNQGADLYVAFQPNSSGLPTDGSDASPTASSNTLPLLILAVLGVGLAGVAGYYLVGPPKKRRAPRDTGETGSGSDRDSGERRRRPRRSDGRARPSGRRRDRDSE